MKSRGQVLALFQQNGGALITCQDLGFWSDPTDNGRPDEYRFCILAIEIDIGDPAIYLPAIGISFNREIH